MNSTCHDIDRYFPSRQTVQLNTLTWTFGEYYAVALAKVWSGTAHIPNQQEMWKKYRSAVAERGGYGKGVLYFSFTGEFLLPAFNQG